MGGFRRDGHQWPSSQSNKNHDRCAPLAGGDEHCEDATSVVAAVSSDTGAASLWQVTGKPDPTKLSSPNFDPSLREKVES
eukprot:1990980-Amphidinium_carterae.1